MERIVIIVNGWKSLTIITKRSILDVTAALDPPLFLGLTLLAVRLQFPANGPQVILCAECCRCFYYFYAMY